MSKLQHLITTTLAAAVVFFGGQVAQADSSQPVVAPVQAQATTNQELPQALNAAEVKLAQSQAKAVQQAQAAVAAAQAQLAAATTAEAKASAQQALEKALADLKALNDLAVVTDHSKKPFGAFNTAAAQRLSQPYISLVVDDQAKQLVANAKQNKRAAPAPAAFGTPFSFGQTSVFTKQALHNDVTPALATAVAKKVPTGVNTQVVEETEATKAARQTSAGKATASLLSQARKVRLSSATAHEHKQASKTDAAPLEQKQANKAEKAEPKAEPKPKAEKAEKPEKPEAKPKVDKADKADKANKAEPKAEPKPKAEKADKADPKQKPEPKADKPEKPAKPGAKASTLLPKSVAANAATDLASLAASSVFADETSQNLALSASHAGTAQAVPQAVSTAHTQAPEGSLTTKLALSNNEQVDATLVGSVQYRQVKTEKALVRLRPLQQIAPAGLNLTAPQAPVAASEQAINQASTGTSDLASALAQQASLPPALQNSLSQASASQNSSSQVAANSVSLAASTSPSQAKQTYATLEREPETQVVVASDQAVQLSTLVIEVASPAHLGAIGLGRNNPFAFDLAAVENGTLNINDRPRFTAPRQVQLASTSFLVPGVESNVPNSEYAAGNQRAVANLDLDAEAEVKPTPQRKASRVKLSSARIASVLKKGEPKAASSGATAPESKDAHNPVSAPYAESVACQAQAQIQNSANGKQPALAATTPAQTNSPPAEAKPADEKPADEKPADSKPADQKLTDEKLTDQTTKSIDSAEGAANKSIILLANIPQPKPATLTPQVARVRLANFNVAQLSKSPLDDEKYTPSSSYNLYTQNRDVFSRAYKYGEAPFLAILKYHQDQLEKALAFQRANPNPTVVSPQGLGAKVDLSKYPDAVKLPNGVTSLPDGRLVSPEGRVIFVPSDFKQDQPQASKLSKQEQQLLQAAWSPFGNVPYVDFVEAVLAEIKKVPFWVRYANLELVPSTAGYVFYPFVFQPEVVKSVIDSPQAYQQVYLSLATGFYVSQYQLSHSYIARKRHAEHGLNYNPALSFSDYLYEYIDTCNHILKSDKAKEVDGKFYAAVEMSCLVAHSFTDLPTQVSDEWNATARLQAIRRQFLINHFNLQDFPFNQQQPPIYPHYQGPVTWLPAVYNPAAWLYTGVANTIKQNLEATYNQQTKNLQGQSLGQGIGQKQGQNQGQGRGQSQQPSPYVPAVPTQGAKGSFEIGFGKVGDFSGITTNPNLTVHNNPYAYTGLTGLTIASGQMGKNGLGLVGNIAGYSVFNLYNDLANGKQPRPYAMVRSSLKATAAAPAALADAQVLETVKSSPVLDAQGQPLDPNLLPGGTIPVVEFGEDGSVVVSAGETGAGASGDQGDKASNSDLTAPTTPASAEATETDKSQDNKDDNDKDNLNQPGSSAPLLPETPSLSTNEDLVDVAEDGEGKATSVTPAGLDPSKVIAQTRQRRNRIVASSASPASSAASPAPDVATESQDQAGQAADKATASPDAKNATNATNAAQASKDSAKDSVKESSTKPSFAAPFVFNLNPDGKPTFVIFTNTWYSYRMTYLPVSWALKQNIGYSDATCSLVNNNTIYQKEFLDYFQGQTLAELKATSIYPDADYEVELAQVCSRDPARSVHQQQVLPVMRELEQNPLFIQLYNLFK